MNILTFVLITIIFQTAVFSSIFLTRLFNKKFPPSHADRIPLGRLGVRLIFVVLAGIVIFALKIFSNQWFLFYVVNFALIVLGIGIWMVINKRSGKRNFTEVKPKEINTNESNN